MVSLLDQQLLHYLSFHQLINTQQHQQVKKEMCMHNTRLLSTLYAQKYFPQNEPLAGHAAICWDLPHVTMDSFPYHRTPLKNLFLNEPVGTYLSLQFLPWDMHGHTPVMAVIEPYPDLIIFLNTHYTHYQLVLVTPETFSKAIQWFFSEKALHTACYHLMDKRPLFSAASLRFSFATLALFVLGVLGLGISCNYTAGCTRTIMLAVNGLYLSTLYFRLYLTYKGITLEKKQNSTLSPPLPSMINWPVYTILVPLYKEQAMVTQLTQALHHINYPKARLDIKIIVEEDDMLTRQEAKSMQEHLHCDIIVVPYALPRTKPKACNYALYFAKGTYVTIYDAEDIPCPDQLYHMAHAFHYSASSTIAFQARLNFYNREENILTRLFALEYGLLFDYLLPALHTLHMPIPLGGTSNHFRKSALLTLGGWDPYNVTEDADLGIRLARKGFLCGTSPSLTLEESPIRLSDWLHQRTRWIKGFMQTYLVHMRNPSCTWRNLGIKGFIGFQYMIGAPVAVFLISPFFWAITIAMLIFPALSGNRFLYDPWIHYSCLASLWMGWIGQWGMASFYAIQKKWSAMRSAILLFPFYWILHSIASTKAVWQLITSPFYWEKTMHGKSKISPSFTHSRSGQEVPGVPQEGVCGRSTINRAPADPDAPQYSAPPAP